MKLGDAERMARVRFVGGRWANRCAVVLDERGHSNRRVLFDGANETDFYLESDRDCQMETCPSEIDAAVLAEREECAKIAEARIIGSDNAEVDGALQAVADEIRARGRQ
jgi:phage terminase Nu1 subunit (DNA packaging protein)